MAKSFSTIPFEDDYLSASHFISTTQHYNKLQFRTHREALDTTGEKFLKSARYNKMGIPREPR